MSPPVVTQFGIGHQLGRAWPGHPREADLSLPLVGGRAKPGQDGSNGDNTGKVSYYLAPDCVMVIPHAAPTVAAGEFDDAGAAFRFTQLTQALELRGLVFRVLTL